MRGVGGLMDFAADAVFDAMTPVRAPASPRADSGTAPDQSFDAHLEAAATEDGAPAPRSPITEAKDQSVEKVAQPEAIAIATPPPGPQPDVIAPAVVVQVIASATPTVQAATAPAITQPEAAAPGAPVAQAPAQPTQTPAAAHDQGRASDLATPTPQPNATASASLAAAPAANTNGATVASAPIAQTAPPIAGGEDGKPVATPPAPLAQSATQAAQPSAPHAPPPEDGHPPHTATQAVYTAPHQARARQTGETAPTHITKDAPASPVAGAAKAASATKAATATAAAAPAQAATVEFAAAPQQGAAAITASAAHQGQQAHAVDHGAARTAPAAAQVAREIIRRFDGGNTQFDLRLDPPELGRVEVRLEVTRDHRVNAVIAADSPQALAELARNARELEQQLQSAGLELGENGLTFDLRQGGEGAAENEDGVGASGQGNEANGAQTEPAPIAARPIGFERWRGVRVDVMV